MAIRCSVFLVASLALLGFGMLRLCDVLSAPANPPGPFDARLLAVAKNYLAWGRVDDETRWAPQLCRRPNAAMARDSQSDDAKTHGQKLYMLFAKDRAAYLATRQKTNPVGQVLVKQSWTPLEVPDDGLPLQQKAVHAPRKQGFGDSYIPFVRRDGKLFKASEQAELFIMMKLDPTTPDTDDGWVYGTVAPDGSRVTSVGKVQSCMRCHTKDTTDRLFGLPGWVK